MILFLTNNPETVKHLAKLAALGVHLPCFMKIVHRESPFSGVPENTNGLTPPGDSLHINQPQGPTSSGAPSEQGGIPPVLYGSGSGCRFSSDSAGEDK